MRLLITLLAATLTKADSMIDWLLSADLVSPDLTMTQALAHKMDRAKLEGLAGQATGGLVLVLPTNEAWLQNLDLYEKLMASTSSGDKLRNDLLFSAGGEMDSVGGFEELLAFADKNDGVVDTAFGTPMKIEADGTVCLAEYDADWQLVTSDCAQLRLPPLMFEDGSLYLTDKIILPETVLEEAAR
eukprot:Blabericola_migrator_1__4463@NODE_2388_length_2843_cov_236_918588_g1495_i0_p2_GENE_NODE_2388_length_2843_cov_236_918588_g1495_i0NODE_2388_length_2843_cov_236_918588_g1495_i0_p2_ORF_typecomplete_len186_score62_27GGDEF_2/PF17853_1/0_1_NODE_2388_length_2843_cov_236_918588_g1495_i012271784